MRIDQAAYVIRQFGNAYALAKAMTMVGRRISPSAIYKWTYPRSKGGTGGLIPTSSLPFIFSAAKVWGVVLDETQMRIGTDDSFKSCY